MSGYLVPAGFGQDEFTEKKSRFIGSVWRCDTEPDALAHINDMNVLHRGAGHNVYAYIIRDNNIMRYSDNGEPQGTAGMPVLEVFRREQITNVCCVVTRYFGGILLGTGGLTRAYSHAAKIALDAAGIAVMRKWARTLTETPYPLWERIKLKFEEYGAVIENIEYGANVLIEALVPFEDFEKLRAEITDLSNGTVAPVTVGETFSAVSC